MNPTSDSSKRYRFAFVFLFVLFLGTTYAMNTFPPGFDRHFTGIVIGALTALICFGSAVLAFLALIGWLLVERRANKET